MPKKARIAAFSLDKKTDNLLNRLQSKFQKNRSELIREMIHYYAESTSKPPALYPKNDFIDDSDANKILKLYYRLIGESHTIPSLVVGICIINKKDKVLIGLRKNKDKFVKDLYWSFPSGKLESLDFKKQILKIIKEKTGYNAKVMRLIHAHLIPDSPRKKIRIVGLYYHCKIVSGTQKPGRDLKELKWVPATEVCQHFTTSVSDEIMTFLGNLN